MKDRRAPQSAHQMGQGSAIFTLSHLLKKTISKACMSIFIFRAFVPRLCRISLSTVAVRREPNLELSKDLRPWLSSVSRTHHAWRHLLRTTARQLQCFACRMWCSDFNFLECNKRIPAFNVFSLRTTCWQDPAPTISMFET